MDAGYNQRPVKFRGDMLPGLVWVEPVQGLGGQPRQDSVTVVQTGGSEGVNEGFSQSRRVMTTVWKSLITEIKLIF